MANECWDIVIVGGGFFGLVIAEHYCREGYQTLVLEREASAMTRASFANQARVHNGYHYPRSLLTAYRSRVNFPKFCNEYREAIISDFTKLYAIPRLGTKVSAHQFKTFMERIGAPICLAGQSFTKLFDSRTIEAVFEVTEYVFDALRLRDLAIDKLQNVGGQIKYETEALSISPVEGHFIVKAQKSQEELFFSANRVINVTYGRMNALNIASGIPIIPLKNELTEMAIVDVPDLFRSIGITVMCGPFFSLMPFPPRDMHTLSHVRYTPHCWWKDEEGAPYRDGYKILTMQNKQTHFPHMIRDASRYVPGLRDTKYLDSIWEIKTVLPISEVDDSRPILFKKDYFFKNYFCVMGGKIDNVFDAIEECRSMEGVQSL